MCAVCGCSWPCRPMWRLLILLAAVPCLLLSSQSPAAVVGKVHPRGKHWAVGHLMGKKSIESQTNPDSHHLHLPEPPGATQHPMEALMLLSTEKQREEERDKYLREMSDLLLLALKLGDQEST